MAQGDDPRAVTFAVIDPTGARSAVHSCTLSEDGKLTMRSTQEWAATDGHDDTWVVQDIVGVGVPGAAAAAAAAPAPAAGCYVGIALALNARTGEFEWLSLRDSIVTAEHLAPLSAWTDQHKVVAADGNVVATGVLTQAPRGSRKREREAAAAAKEKGDALRLSKVPKK